MRAVLSQRGGKAADCLRRWWSSGSAGSAGPGEVVVAHSSWFRVEEQGMDEYDLLSRGTAFCVRGDVTGSTHILVSAHVAAPFRFPQYYPQEWLRFVNHTHCLHRFHMGQDPHPLFEVGGLGVIFHPTMDLAAITVRASTQSDAGNDDNTTPPLPDILRFPASAEEERAGSAGPLVIHGFSVDDSSSSSAPPVRTARHGAASAGDAGPGRWVARTHDGPTVMGMCGGPVCAGTAADTAAGSAASQSVVLGMLEGLVVDGENGAAKGDSVFIGGRELREFVNAVEAAELTEAARAEEAARKESDPA